MTSSIVPSSFNFEGTDLEVQLDEVTGEPWFAASKIGEILGYSKDSLRNMVKDHVNKADVSKRQTRSSGQTRNVNFINESGLYSLILGSKLPKAKEFKHWITSEVLPSICKTGSYSLNQEPVQRVKGDEMSTSQQMLAALYKVQYEAKNGKSPEGFQYAKIATEVNKGSLGDHYKGIRQDLTREGASRLSKGLLTTFHEVLGGNLSTSTYKPTIENKIGIANKEETVVKRVELPESKKKELKRGS